MESLLVCTTSKEMWDSLLSIHEQKSETHKLLMSQKFHEYRMEPNDTIVQHISKLQNLATQLIDIGENIPDIFLMSKILASLPPKYRHFRTSWGNIESGRQTIELLKARLIEEESYHNADENEARHWQQPRGRRPQKVRSQCTRRRIFKRRKTTFSATCAPKRVITRANAPTGQTNQRRKTTTSRRIVL